MCQKKVHAALLTIALLPQVPRALVTEDLIWFVGSAWGSLFGWAQLLSLYLARTAAGYVQTQDCDMAWMTALAETLDDGVCQSWPLV